MAKFAITGGAVPDRRLTATVTLIAAALTWAAPAAALTDAEILNLKGPDRQKILEAGARKEGKLVWYTAMIVDQTVRPLSDAFSKKYPYLKVEFWRGSSRQIIQKVTAEARAKSVQGDVTEFVLHLGEALGEGINRDEGVVRPGLGGIDPFLGGVV